MIGLIEVFLFLCVVYYLFGKRTGDMVDVISTRFQGMYGSWNYFNNNSAENMDRTKEKKQDRDDRHYKEEIQSREDSLYKLKDSPPDTINPTPSTGTSLSCRTCSPGQSEVQLTPQDRRRTVIDVLQTRSQLPANLSRFSPSYWFQNVAQSVSNHKYIFPDVSDQVLADERIKTAIDQASVESLREYRELAHRGDRFDEDKLYAKMVKKNKARAQKVLLDMKAKFSNVVLAFTSWLVYTFLPMFLSGAILHPGQLEMIKTAMKKSPNTPLIFLPLHRSHVDYILVTFMSLNNDIQSPVVVAGDNLKIPVVGAMLRGLGAFFIKRKIDPVTGKKDIVYRSVLHSYLQHCLTAGHNIEAFMEGGRTRTGKPCMPKGGVLSVIIDAFVEGTVKDVLLVPVSMNYEKLVDGNFVNEQLGQRKRKETLFKALKVFWQSIHSHYGLMRIDFNEPFSLKDIVSASRRIQDQQQLAPLRSAPEDKILQQTKSSTSLFGTDIVEEELRSIVDNVARHVVYDCATATTVMSTNAVIFLLLHRFRNGVALDRLAESLDELRVDLEGRKDLAFTGSSKEVIMYVAKLMGPTLIRAETTRVHGEEEVVFVKPVHTIETMLELSYYANTLMPHYALESVIATVVYALLKRDYGSDMEMMEEEEEAGGLRVNQHEVMSLAVEFCDILRYEFILHKPCQDLTVLLYEALDRFEQKGFIKVARWNTINQDSSERYANADVVLDADSNEEFSDDEGHVVEPIDVNREILHELKIFVGLLAPISNTYLTVVECLNGLLGNNCIVESEFYKICIKQLKENYRSGLNKFGESVSLEMVKSCSKLLEKWAVTKIESDAGVRLLVLTDGYKSSDAIESVYDRMQKFVPSIELPPLVDGGGGGEEAAAAMM